MAIDWNALFSGAARAAVITGREAAQRRLRPDNVPLAWGLPYPGSFDLEALADAARATLADEGPAAPNYGGGPSAARLREFLADRARRAGIAATPDNILVTVGSGQALDLVCRLLLDPGDFAMVEAPTYMGALRAMRNCRARVLSFPMDGEGLIVDAVAEELARRARAGEPAPKLLYTIPNFQNPGGVTMSDARRDALLELAGRHGFAVVEDDAYGDLGLARTPPASLRARDREGRVIQLKTFSKIVSPGVRLGWIVADPAVVSQVSRMKVDGGTSGFTQAVIYRFCTARDIDAHIGRLRAGYAERSAAMLAALEECMPAGCSWTTPAGGFFVWLSAPAGVDMGALQDAAADAGVSYAEGGIFFADASAGRGHARLSFSYPDPAAIREGVRRLAGVVREAAAVAAGAG